MLRNFLFFFAFSALLIPQVTAQIVPDQTLPNNSLIISPDGQTILINGGTQAGRNLFHSFQDFNINSGQFVLVIGGEFYRDDGLSGEFC